MHFDSLSAFLADGKSALVKGPIGLILLEDDVEVESTIRHHLDIGLNSLIVIGAPSISIDAELLPRITHVVHDMLEDDALTHVVNSVIRAAGDQWIYYCYNAEYLFYPFCEHRQISEMIAFNLEERRHTILSYVVDLYAGDLDQAPGAVALNNAYLDRSGYYALARLDDQNHPKERELNFFGGLRWRFEEHIPSHRRRIDRVAIFQAKPGLKFLPDHTFNDPEYNTYACPWHNSISAAVCSFRTAKALRTNAGSKFDIDTFRWRNSASFDWHSQQLLDLGFMEPGQWF